MKRLPILLLCLALPSILAAQQFKFNLEHLAAKATNRVDLDLNGATLQLAAKFLDSNDPDEAQVKKLIAGLEGIYIRHYTFKVPLGPGELESVRAQLRTPEWSRIVGVKSEEEGETDEVYLRTTGNKMAGVAIIASEPKELTVVHIAGPIDLDSLAALGGHMGIPKLVLPETKQKKEL